MEKKVLNYRIIIEPEKYEDGSTVYTAICPTLGVADYGDTVEEVLKSIKDGIKLAIEFMAENKEEIPVDHIENQIIATTKIELPNNLKVTLSY